MLHGEIDRGYPSVKTLVKDRVASRVHRKDSSLYDFSDQARQVADEFMGWVDLATNPPVPIEQIEAFAQEVFDEGYQFVLLIGEGGSTQAPMTITKYNSVDTNALTFRVLDSVSPVRVRSTFAEFDLNKTLVIISSKSGTTIEPRSVLHAVYGEMVQHMPADQVGRHLVAITDPGSELEELAKSEGWRQVFLGEPSVGGRYSALSVFGLVPAALVGINLGEYIEHARQAEALCSEDSIDNPASILAAYLYDNYVDGRDKFCFLTPKRGRVLGLWIEQLVAESLGKEGQGILPNIEIDPLQLAVDHRDRTAVMYKTQTDYWDERKNFEMSQSYMHPAIPRINYQIDSVAELAEHFVMWEYAVAMCAYLMKVCPFDQPDVSVAKGAVLDILANGHPKPDLVQNTIGFMHMGEIEVRLGRTMEGAIDLEDALAKLMESVRPGDYFALNAFLPFSGEGRREALEQVRHCIADTFGVVSCLEIGPRYLHSTGQLQKGGPNNGVFLIVSADELKDIPVEDGPTPSLAELAKAQAEGDLKVLSERRRRCIHVHLPDNSGIMLRQLADVVQRIALNVKA